MEYRRKWSVSKELANKFKTAGAEQGWLEGSRSLVLAVSGGSDSVALVALAFCLLPRDRLVMAHFEHGIRGEASLADARFVESFAEDLGLPLECRHVITEEHRNAHESLESTARRLRYSFLSEVASKYGNAWIATGHTVNDVQETVLFNLFRGTGIRGLGGIPPIRGSVVRPLLACSREELRNFLRQNGLAWKEDATNEDISYARNYIRKVLLPQIRENINPQAGEHLAHLAGDARIIRERDEAFYGNMLSLLQREMPLSLVSWDLRQTRQLSSWDLRMALMEQARLLGIPPLSRNRMERLEKLIRTSGRWCFQWKKEVECLCGSGLLSWISPRERNFPKFQGEMAFEVSGSFRYPWGPWLLQGEVGSASSSSEAIFGSHAILLSGEFPRKMDVCSLEKWILSRRSEEKPLFWETVPWWARSLWPVVRWGGEGIWIPRIGGDSPDCASPASCSGENHVTIVRLLCRPLKNFSREKTENLD